MQPTDNDHNNYFRYQILYTPISNYATEWYNTVCSVVQAFSLGTLFFEYSQLVDAEAPISAAVYLHLILTFGFITGVWYRYLTHNNFVAWKMNVSDLVIPLVFSAIQSFLALSVTNPFQFAFGLLALISWVVVAYGNARLKHGKSEVISIYRIYFLDHLKHHGYEYTNDISDQFLEEIRSFEKREIIIFLGAFNFWGVACVLIACSGNPSESYIIGNLIMGFATVGYGLFNNILTRLEAYLDKTGLKMQQTIV